MQRLSNWLYERSTGWLTLLALISFLVFSAFVLPDQSAKAELYSGGSDSPDTSLFYSGQDLYQMAKTFGVEGRHYYLKARWTFDLAFPLVYTFFLATSVSWLLQRTLPPGSKWRLINLIPITAMLFDFLENTAASLVMLRFPVSCPPGEFLAPIFTPVKWLFVSLSFVLVLIAMILLAVKKLKWNMGRK